ncbi:ABC-three component system protein [Chryseobacterium sp. CFBP8996]|uniref:ABC-three component system protein n=1 Tax=Chryseobacterium sp. CFBP8996 TaxID=3096529 RepID=UPI002A6AADF6|nr:ABC-three component system protein [Chryseobacterium sp. CFBP8996]MDY0931624.1 ABC-three component system protein [Chryseobacterium sp. CFBP8996]
MSTDATPSWSGYIFQGEVALCKAIETIISLGDTIPDDFCLRLEQDEDFSLKTDSLEVFQVKAYLSQDADKLSKYKDVIRELIEKYHYSKCVTKDPRDRRRTLTTFRIHKRKKPINCSLVTDKVILDYETDLSSFEDRYKSINFNKFSVIQGVYTLENISDKIDTQIRNLLSADTYNGDVALKRNFCLNNIVNSIKLRHRTKRIQSIPLKEIKKWIIDSDLAYNEDIFWLTVIKSFLKKLSETIPHYDMRNPNDIDLCRKVTECYENIDSLDFDIIKKLVKERINAHSIFNSTDIRMSSISYLNTDSINNIITKAIEGIIKVPDYEKLIYNHNNEKYQLSLISYNISNPPNQPDKIKLLSYFKNIQENNLTDIDYIVTDQLTLEKSSVADLRRNITDIPNTDTDINITDPTKSFGLKKLSDTIADLNI